MTESPKEPTARPMDNTENDPLLSERRTLVGEFWGYLMENKKWWMLPILVVIVLLAILIALAATGAAPFIYPLI